MILLAIALFGLLVPNGIFMYWLFYEYDGLTNVAQNKLALAFIKQPHMTQARRRRVLTR